METDSPDARAKQPVSRLGLQGVAEARKLLFFEEPRCEVESWDGPLVAKRRGDSRPDRCDEQPQKKLF